VKQSLPVMVKHSCYCGAPTAVNSDNSSGVYVKKKAVPKKMAPGASAGAIRFRHPMGRP
jgi:hypothetical protein